MPRWGEEKMRGRKMGCKLAAILCTRKKRYERESEPYTVKS
jgi:hypothetical protein